PRFDGVMNRFVDALRDQETFEERRTAYVALTRAKQRLYCSSAVWYGENLRAKKVGRFFLELVAWGRRTGQAAVLFEADENGSDETWEETNPLAGVRQGQMRGWPGAALEAARRGSVPEELLDRLAPDERAGYEDLVSERLALAAHLVERERMTERGPEPPPAVGVTGLIDYGRCPKRFYWSFVRPLPRFSGPAARIGTEI